MHLDRGAIVFNRGVHGRMYLPSKWGNVALQERHDFRIACTRDLNRSLKRLGGSAGRGLLLEFAQLTTSIVQGALVFLQCGGHTSLVFAQTGQDVACADCTFAITYGVRAREIPFGIRLCTSKRFAVAQKATTHLFKTLDPRAKV